MLHHKKSVPDRKCLRMTVATKSLSAIGYADLRVFARFWVVFLADAALLRLAAGLATAFFAVPEPDFFAGFFFAVLRDDEARDDVALSDRAAAGDRPSRAASTLARSAAMRSTTVPASAGCSAGYTTSRPSTLASMKACRASR
jgi:hypothetical protein